MEHAAQDEVRLKDAIDKLVDAVRDEQSVEGEVAALTTLVAQLRSANEHLVQAAVRSQVLQEEAEARNRQQNEFLAMLAHELRNPLAPISAAAQLLKLPGVDARRIEHSSDVISRQVKHMTELVDDLLDVSRVTRGLVTLTRKNLDLKRVVASAVEQARPSIEARRHSLSLSLDGDTAMVNGDQTRLVQVIVNLLTNAAKYTPQGGQIEVRLDVEGNEVRLCVSDNGSGIEPKLLPHIFDLFTQGERTPDRAQGGLGLGLALVKSMVGLHGGRVEALSDGPGRGSTFVLYLPMVDDTPAHVYPERRHNTPEAAFVPMRIMIVDDNVDAAESLAALLRFDGHDVTVMEDAHSTITRAAQVRPDVFILDIGLPDMDGYQLVRALRAQGATAAARFIALTGYGQAHDKVLAKSAGFDHHFVKPVDWQELAAVLASQPP
ncbi:response regulator [Massilia sp. PAMC28688]|uniref:hybrid sensor histidine kinase/response regulator n=1 Tax=Massilia sp. PAMC28688 TaxID=2861283 RepID=UPI001C631AA3|nr:ATP-binding protein [Massilia sp. PAMC28688]QYF95493.1 response regulator [Massilia sp. PAMC28688]